MRKIGFQGLFTDGSHTRMNGYIHVHLFSLRFSTGSHHAAISPRVCLFGHPVRSVVRLPHQLTPIEFLHKASVMGYNRKGRLRTGIAVVNGDPSPCGCAL